MKGSCDKDGCLLYHEKTYAKLPACHFFLQGLCVKTDCPYLHKKVNDKASICTEFLRGYCSLAEKVCFVQYRCIPLDISSLIQIFQCQKRHVLLCPEYERNGECKVSGCVNPHPRRRKEFMKRPKLAERKPKLEKTIHSSRRYFIDESETNDDTKENNNKSIELSLGGKATLARASIKVEQMKNYINLGTENDDIEQVNPVSIPTVMTSNWSLMANNSDSIDANDNDRYLLKRPKLGNLPSFIPIE